MRKALISGTVMGLALVACTPAETPPVATPQPSASVTPLPAPTPAPTATPAPSPTPAPIATPTPLPTPTPVPTPTPEPIPTPEPEPIPELFETGSLRVRVFGDNDSPLSNAIVDISSTDSSKPFTARPSFVQGAYSVTVPTRLTLKVEVTAPGHNSRSLNVALSPTETTRELEFKGAFALSDRPEVVGSTPAHSGSIAANAPIELRFSENVDRESVESSFAIQAVGNTQFLVGTPAPLPLTVRPNAAEVLFDRRHVTVEWETDRIVRFRPKFGWPMTQLKDFRLSLSYNDGTGNPKTGGMRDTNGTQARIANISFGDEGESGGINSADGPFAVGNSYRPYLPFSVTGEADAVHVTSVGGASLDQQSFFINFSKDLYFYLPSGAMVVGGANGSGANAPAGLANVSPELAAQNYRLTCNDTPVTLPATAVAVFQSPTQVRVSVPAGETLFTTGEICRVNFSSILDASGRFIANPSLSFIAP